MQNFTNEFYAQYKIYICSLYFIFTAIKVGLAFGIAFVSKPILFSIKIPRVKYQNSIELVRRYMIFSLICLIFISLSGLLLLNAQQSDHIGPLKQINIHVIEAILLFMTLNILYIYLKFNEAKRHFFNNENIQIHENLEIILNYIVPLNLFLGVVLICFDLLVGIK